MQRTHERAALAYLAQSPFEHVFLSWLIASDRSLVTRSALYVYLDRQAQIRGVAFFGKQIVLAADDDAVTEAFARIAPAFRFERMIVAPRRTAERYWSCVKAWHSPPRIVRESQPVMAVDRDSLRRIQDGVRVRRARAGEWEAVARNSAQMIQHELEYDPRRFAAEFNANVRIMIDRGLWWVGEREGELCFFCNAGPRSVHTLQLQGIWTPPPLRGRGLATAALAGICSELLAETPTLSLYVNSFNTDAIRLYERVGFRQVGEFSTLLF